MDNPTVLTSGSNTTDASSFVTASIAPADSKLVLAFVSWTPDSGDTPPTLTGGGMAAWEVINSGEYGGVGAGRLLATYRALEASPGSGAVTINCGVNTASCIWAFIEIGGTIPDVEDAVVQLEPFFPSSSVAGAAVTLDDPFADAANMGIAAVSHAINEDTVPEAGWTELVDFFVASPGLRLAVYYKTNDNAFVATFDTAQTRGAVLLEIANALAGLYTVVNASDEQLVNINAGGADVDASSYKDAVQLTQAELAALLDGTTFGRRNVCVLPDQTSVAALRGVIKQNLGTAAEFPSS